MGTEGSSPKLGTAGEGSERETPNPSPKVGVPPRKHPAGGQSGVAAGNPASETPHSVRATESDCADFIRHGGQVAVMELDEPNPSAHGKEQAESESQESERDSEGRLVRLERRESVALLILATLAVFYALYAARAIMMPMTFSLLLTLTLRPVVRKLRHFGCPDVVGAGLALFVLLAVFSVSTSRLLGPAREWARDLPQELELLQVKLRKFSHSIRDLERTSSKVQQMTEGDPAEQPVPVQIKQSELSTNVARLSYGGSLLASTVLVFCLAFFMLAWGDRMLNNVLHLLNTWSEKKRTVELVLDVERGIASYLLTVTIINVLLGVATFFAMWMLGVPNPGLWGLMATTFNYVPIFGAIVGFLILLVVSILSFDSMAYAALPPLVFCTLTTIEGNLITPSILGKRMSLNPILVFIALIFWGWIWGVGGAFLAVPVLAVVKLCCERFQKTKPISVLMEA